MEDRDYRRDHYDVLCAPAEVWEHVALQLESPRDVRSLACAAGPLSTACRAPMARLRRRRLARRVLSRWMRFPGIKWYRRTDNARRHGSKSARRLEHVSERLREMSIPAHLQRTLLADMHRLLRLSRRTTSNWPRSSYMVSAMLHAVGLQGYMPPSYESFPLPWGFHEFWERACVRLRLCTSLVLPDALADDP